jgi:hypothetical protein
MIQALLLWACTSTPFEPSSGLSSSATSVTEAEGAGVPLGADVPTAEGSYAGFLGERSSAAMGDARLSLRFADHLFLDGDYYRAITEYRRFLFLVQGQGSDASRAAMAMGEALLRGEQWDAAGRQFDGIAARTGELSLRHEALFGAARAYLEDARPELAKPRFRLIATDESAEPALREESRWLLAWGHFDAGELSTARTLFADLSRDEGPHRDDAGGVVDAMDDREHLDLKDPLLAALFSLVPGGGHFYLGQWATGLTALTWNGLFLFAAASAWLAGDWGVAVVLTVAELGWYSGSMFGAISGAYRHNRDAVRNWRDEVLTRFGTERSLPEVHQVIDEPPGTVVRLRGTF